MGIVGLAFNMTAGLELQRKTNCLTPLIILFFVAFMTLVASLVTRSAGAYVCANMLFYLCNSTYLPLQQALAMRQCRADHGTVSGIFSSIRVTGMVTGSLSAGFLYARAPLLPMGVCAVLFLLTALCTWVNFKKLPANRPHPDIDHSYHS